MAYQPYPTMPTYGNYIPLQAPTQSGMFYWVQSKQVQNLLSSGQMSQEQFGNLSNMANSFFSMFGR